MVRLLRDRDLAEDATQEVFLRMHRALDRFDTNRSFKTWLYTIAWNFARDHMRRRQRRGTELSLSAPSGRGAGDDRGASHGADVADSAALTPSDIAEKRERTAFVRQALDSLDPGQRALLVLREYEGLSYDELARVLGCRLGTVKSRVHRARSSLRDALGRLCPDVFDATTDKHGATRPVADSAEREL